MKRSRLLLVAMIAALIAVTPALGSGALDRGFGGDGRVVRDLARFDSAESLAFRDGGSFLVASTVRSRGGWAVAVFALRRDGRIDRSFGADGRRIIARPGREYSPRVGLDSRGRVVVTFATDTSGAGVGIARLSRSGDLDDSFGGNGVKTIGYEPNGNGGSRYTAQDFAIDSRDRIVVAGTGETETGGFDFGVLRLRGDGRLDPGFGDRGRVLVDVESGVDAATSVILDEQGRVLLAGSSRLPEPRSPERLAIVRLTPDGGLDQSFAGGGATRFDELPAAADLVGFDDSSFAVIGTAVGDFSLARFDADGELDPEFSGDGVAGVDFYDSKDSGVALVRHGEGLAAVGTVRTARGGDDFGVAAVGADGTLDESFGRSGLRVVDFGRPAEGAQSAAGDRSRGRLLIGGYVRSRSRDLYSDRYDTAIARLRVGRISRR